MRLLSHLADHVLRQALIAASARNRASTAELLVHIAEFDARRLYLPAGFPSMHLYCVRELHMSEDTAFKRCQAARAARDFPSIIDAIADGRLHVSAVVMLAPHLTSRNSAELLEASSGKTKSEISLLLAERFPRADVPESVRALATICATEGLASIPTLASTLSPAPGQVISPPAPPRPMVAPLSPGRYELRLTLDEETHSLLRMAQELLGHAIPSGNIALVLKRALAKLVEVEEKRVFAASSRTRVRRGKPKGRYVPAEVRREVLLRDGRQCAFKSDSGERCPSRTRLQFDHVTPVARGGESTAANLRLLCSAHNRHEADRVFGAGFMARKVARPERREVERAAPALAPGPVEPQACEREDVIPWLRQMGFRKDEARRGAAMCEELGDASIEQRLRVARSGLARARYRLSPRQASAVA